MQIRAPRNRTAYLLTMQNTETNARYAFITHDAALYSKYI